MIDVDALLRRAERELTEDDALMRTAKTGILFGTLATAMQQYTKVQFTIPDVLALLDILARHGKLYDGLQLSDLRMKLAPMHDGAREAVSQNGHAPGPGSAVHAPSEGQQALSPEELFEQDDVRAALKQAYPSFTDAEINALVEAQAKIQGGNVVARTDAELAAYEAEQKNPFPGAPRGVPLNDFTMTENIEVPADLNPAQS